MKIAIHTADLDHSRIDGTRVYMLNVLKYLGRLAPAEKFLLYHKGVFNKQLAPPNFSNYLIKKIKASLLWTQTIFAWRIFCDKPEVLWMPMHNLPILRRKKLKTVVTIHDLAFKHFPHYFPKKDVLKLNLLSRLAVERSDRIIAVSESTKKDILHFFPKIEEKKIKVVHHGFDVSLFSRTLPSIECEQMLSKFKIQKSKFILYVGAIQPRKNLIVLVESFEHLHEQYPELKLVLVGEKAWMWEGIVERIERSSARESIVLTGKVPFSDLPVFYQNAAVFVFPELYAGFGIPILEAFASNVPVVAARNSSLVEIGADGATYFESKSSRQLMEKMKELMENDVLREKMLARGRERLKFFSWEKSSQGTLDCLTKW